MNRVIFALPGKAHFTWARGFDGVDDVEIKELITESTYALGLLQHELSLRQQSSPPTEPDPKLEYCYEKLKRSAQRLKDGVSFDDLDQLTNRPQASDRSIEVIRLGLTKLQPKSRDQWSRDTYDEVLWLVSRLISPSHALLVKCSFGKNRVTGLDIGGRAKLIQYVKQNQDSLFCPAIQKRVIELAIPNDGT